MNKKIKNTIISLLLSLAMIVTYIPVTNWVGEGSRADAATNPFQVGNNTYATFADAYNACPENGTIYMLDNATLNSGFSIGKNIILDGRGKTLKDNVKGQWAFWTGKAITFRCVSIERVADKSGAFGAFIHVGENNPGNVVFDHVVFRNYENGSIIYQLWNSKVYLRHVESTVTDYFGYEGGSQYYNDCQGVKDTAKFTLPNDQGTTRGYGYFYLPYAIQFAALGGTVTVLQDFNEDIEISSNRSIVLDLAGKTINGVITVNGTLEIKDSKGGGKVTKGIVNNGTLKISGGTIEKSSDNIIYNKGTLTISGGTIKKDGARGIQSDAGTVTITGGNICRADFCGGTVNVTGGTFTTVNHCGAFYVNKATANISGGTFTGSGTDASAITVAANGTVNLSGGTATYDYRVIALRKSGTLNISGNPTLTGRIWAESGSTLKIDGGTFKTTSSNQPIYSEGATITINGGTFNGNNGETPAISATSGTITINGGDLTRVDMQGKGTINVTGGTLKGGNGAALYGANGAILNVTGGTYKLGGGGISVNGATLNLSGGKILYPNGQAVAAVVGGTINITGYPVISGNIVNSATVSIAGGYYDTKPDSKYFKSGYKLFYSKDGGEGTKYIVTNGGGDPCAAIGDLSFAKLSDAFNAVEANETLTILKNVTDTVTVTNSKNYTLDLNGKTIAAAITNNGNLTIKDSVGGGKNTKQIKNAASGTLTVAGGTLENGTDISLKNYGTVNMTGGSVSRLDTYAGGTTNISGGKCYASIQSAVYVEGTGVVNITGGTIEGSQVQLEIGGNLNISGGEVTAPINVKNKNNTTGTKLTISGNAKVTGDIKVYHVATAEIKGGTVTGNIFSNENSTVTVTGDAKIGGVLTRNGSSTLEVTGGYFKTTPDSSLINSDYYVKNVGGDYPHYITQKEIASIDGTVYGSLKTAVSIANKGASITLLTDTNESVVLNKDLTLDLAGHSITGTGSAALTVAGKVEIKNSSSTQSKLSPKTTGEDEYAIVNYGNLTLSGDILYDQVTNADATDKSPKVGSAYGTSYSTPTLNINAGTFVNKVYNSSKGKIVVTDGWFSQQVPESFIPESSGLYPSNSLKKVANPNAPYTVGYKLTLDLNFEGAEEEYYYVGPKAGFTISDLSIANPVREEHNFMGWTYDAEGTNKVGTNDTISKDTTVYATWKVKDPWDDDCTGGTSCKHKAAIGNRHYKTVYWAFYHSKTGDVIKLLCDSETSVEVASDKSLTLDLNGYTLSQGDAECAIIANKGTLTIKDSSASKSGCIEIPKASGTEEVIENIGTLTIEAGTLYSENANVPVLSNVGGTVNINGGKITSSKSYGIYNGSSSSKVGTMNVNGGTISALIYGIWTTGNGKLTVNGGEIKSTRSYGIYNGMLDSSGTTAYEGNTVVTGGTIISNATEDDAAAIGNLCGNVTVSANANDFTYPRLGGRHPVIGSTIKHSTKISGGWYSSELLPDSSTTVADSSGNAMKATSAISGTGIPAQYPYTVGYKVTFVFNDGITTNLVKYIPFCGAKLSEPSTPTRIGYFFKGWYSNSTLTTIFDFTPVVKSNLTLYGKWTEGTQASITGTKYNINNQYWLTVKPSNYGEIKVTQESGVTVRIDLTPMSGYQVASFFIDGDYVNSGYKAYRINLKADTTISATFLPQNISAEEYREQVEKQKEYGDPTEYETNTYTSGEKVNKEYKPSSPNEKTTKDKTTGGTSEAVKQELDKQTKDKKVKNQDGKDYNPGDDFTKVIKSKGGGDKTVSSKEIGGKDSEGWYYYGSVNIDDYVPADSELEHLVLDTTLPEEDQLAQIKKYLALYKFNIKTGLCKSPKGKKCIKLVFYDKTYSTDILDGVEVYRSTKKTSGYGKKAKFTTVTGKYYNTDAKKNKTYYYKVRGYIKFNGKKYYTSWSSPVKRKASYGK